MAASTTPVTQFVGGHPSLQAFLEKYPNTRYLDAWYPDLSCVIRGKRYPVEQTGKLFRSGMMVPGASFLLGANGDSMDPEGMGFSDGDPDEVGMPVPGTLVNCPWAQVPTGQVMVSLQGLDGEPYYYEPRNVLARVLDRFGELELKPVVAFELEFYLLDLERTPEGRIQVPVGPLSGHRSDTTQVYSMEDVEEFVLFLDDVTRTCREQGVETGAISGEYAPGQFEINLMHTDDPLAAADHCMMFRRAVMSTARRHGCQATFMAKPRAEQSGSGLHLHVSLVDRDGNNVFDGGGRYGDRDCGSDLLYHALGGLGDTMADCLGVLAPNINSYRRFVPNMCVPVTSDWAFENRSVAFRVPKSVGAARRIEHRVSGADANPYLVLGAVLAGIHHGIVNRIQAKPPVTGNAGENADPDLPFELTGAFARTRASGFLADYFGEAYMRAYTSCKLIEYQAFVAEDLEETAWYL